MEDGIKSLPQPIRFLGTSTVFLQRAPVATSSYGVLNLGGPFDGTSTNRFSGSGSGTVLAINTPSGFLGNVIDARTANNTVFRVTNGGAAYLGGDLQVAGGQLFVSSILDPPGTYGHISLTSTTTTINTGAAANVGVVVKGATSQSADLQQWQSSAAALLSKVDSNGHFTIGQQLAAQALVVTANYNADLISLTRGGGTGYMINVNQTGGQCTAFGATTTSGASVQNNPNTIFYGNGTYQHTGAQGMGRGIDLTIVNNTGNTGTLWGALISVTANTAGATALGLQVSAASSGGSSTVAQLNCGNATTLGAVIKGAASQSADLQQWQSSAAAVLAKVDASGNAFANAVTPTSGARITSGSGAPSTPGGANPTAGDFYLRTDTPSTANQRVYVCVSGGASPTWAGIV